MSGLVGTMPVTHINISEVNKHLDRMPATDPDSGPYITADDLKNSFTEFGTQVTAEFLALINGDVKTAIDTLPLKLDKGLYGAPGNLLYGGATASTPASLSIGTQGQVLTVNNANGLEWSNALTTVTGKVTTLETNLSQLTTKQNADEQRLTAEVSRIDIATGVATTTANGVQQALAAQVQRIDDLNDFVGLTGPALPKTIRELVNDNTVALGTVGTAIQAVQTDITDLKAIDIEQRLIVVEGYDLRITGVEDDAADLWKFLNDDDGSDPINAIGMYPHLIDIEIKTNQVVADFAAFKAAANTNFVPTATFTALKDVVDDAATGLVKKVTDLDTLVKTKADDSQFQALKTSAQGTETKATASAATIADLKAKGGALTAGSTLADVIAVLQNLA